jgi:hypothetical protein
VAQLYLWALGSILVASYDSRGYVGGIPSRIHTGEPQPGGPGPRIYIPQEQGGPVTPLGTRFPFCCLLRLAGLRWRYSNLLPHGCFEENHEIVTNEVEVEVTLRPTVSRPVYLGVRRPSGTCGQIFFLLEISFRQLRVCYFVAPSLTRGRVCNLLTICFWALSDHSLLGRSPPELTTIFYCLIWDFLNLEGQAPVFISPRFMTSNHQTKLPWQYSASSLSDPKSTNNYS